MDYESTINNYSIVTGKRIIIDPFRFVVVVDGREIILYPKEFNVLYYLACHPGWVLSAEQIYYAIWHDNLYGCEHVIYNTVKYSLQGTTQGRYLTGGVPPVRFSM